MLTDCPECDGTGTLVASLDRFSRSYMTCPMCDGSGVVEPDEDPDKEEAQ